MPKNRKLRVELRAEEQQQLEELLRGGSEAVRVVKRAQALRLLNAGQTPTQVGRNVGLNAETVRAIGWRYRQGRLRRALYDQPRPGAKPKVPAAGKQRVVAMVCGPPPEGRARWTVVLVREEAVKRKLIPAVGRETIRLLLKGHGLKPWREKNVVRAGDRLGVSAADGRRAGPLRAAVEREGAGGLFG